jgi:coenzyme F420-dependent glucose-6-phosphate dehydrogenase
VLLDCVVAAEQAGFEVVKQKVCLSTRAEDHVRYAQQHINLGFTHLYYHSAGPDQRRFLEDYGRDVLPAIRQRELATA